MTWELYFTILWCLAKPVLFFITPALLTGEYILFRHKFVRSRRHTGLKPHTV